MMMMIMIIMMMMIQQSAPAGQTLVTPRPATLPPRDYRAQPQQTVVRASLAPLPPRQGDNTTLVTITFTHPSVAQLLAKPLVKVLRVLRLVSTGPG